MRQVAALPKISQNLSLLCKSIFRDQPRLIKLKSGVWHVSQCTGLPSALQNPCSASDPHVCVGAFGGRIDHVLSSLCTLHRHEGEKIILCGDGNLVRLLPRGHTDLEPDLDVEGPACGLVALAAPATASSRGLKWNLGGSSLLYGPSMPELQLHPTAVLTNITHMRSSKLKGQIQP